MDDVETLKIKLRNVELAAEIRCNQRLVESATSILKELSGNIASTTMDDHHVVDIINNSVMILERTRDENGYEPEKDS